MRAAIIVTVLISFEALAVGCGEQILRAVDGGSSSRIANQQVASIIDETPRVGGSSMSSTEIKRVEDGLGVVQARPEAFYETVKTKAAGVMSRENGMFQGIRYSNIEELETAIARDTKSRISKGQLIFNPRDGNFYTRVNAPRAGSDAAVAADRAMDVTTDGFPMNLYVRHAEDVGDVAATTSRFTFTPDQTKAREAINAIAESPAFESSRAMQSGSMETTLIYKLEPGGDFSRTLRDLALPPNPNATLRTRWSNLDHLEFVVRKTKSGSKTLFYKDITGNFQKISAPSKWGFGTVIAAP